MKQYEPPTHETFTCGQEIEHNGEWAFFIAYVTQHSAKIYVKREGKNTPIIAAVSDLKSK